MKKKKIILSTTILLIIILLLAIITMVISFVTPSLFNKKEFEFEAVNLIDQKQLYPTSHDGKNYYISSDGGNDVSGADGSIDKPYNIDFFRWFSRDKEEGTVIFKPGDQILLRCGDVFNDNLELHYLKGSADNPITISSYIDPKNPKTEKPYIEIEYDKISFHRDYTGIAAGVILESCSNVVVRDLEINIKWKSRNAVLNDGAGGIIAEYDLVGNNRYENIYIVNNTIHSECLDANNPWDANTFGIKINSYEKSYDTTPNDFVLKGAYVTNNEVYNIGRGGIVAHGWMEKERMVQMKYTCFTDVHLDNNIVYNVGTIGIYAGATTGCTMNRNLVYNTGMYVCNLEKDESPQEGEGGLMSMCLKDGEIKYNVTYNNYRQGILNDGIGIDIDWNSMNIVVQYNYVSKCDGSGIGTMANYNCKITNNRVIDNPCITNHPGQISVCDYVPWGDPGALAREYMEKNSPNTLSVRNLEISENFISASPKNGVGVNPNKCLFYARRGNGIGSWFGNSFHDNHLVYSGVDNDFFYNMIANESNNLQDTVCWDKFYNNKYFAKNLTTFNCIDETVFNDNLNNETIVPICTDFSSWEKRDLRSTFEEYTYDKMPSKPTMADVKYKDEKLNIKWKKSSGNIWHYNIYKIDEDEQISYRNLLEQVKTTSFDFIPEEKGTFYIVIQPENNMGITGEALKIKISLK